VAIFAFSYSRSTNKATVDAAERAGQATVEAAKDSTDKTVNVARETNQATIDAAREAQFPDRYSRAIEQLGSDNLDVRIGGIYALEGIAVESARHHPTVMEVLAAFIREHSREQGPAPEEEDAARPRHRGTQPDVQAALTVIGRRAAARDRQPIDLKGADLTRADLTGAHLGGATLRRAVLTSADLTRAILTRADLTRANLTWAALPGANLSGANLSGSGPNPFLYPAGLTREMLRGAILKAAVLTDADLTNADLTWADLTGADLTGADLTGADLTGVKFDGAVPEGWARNPETGQLQRSDEQQRGQPSAGVDGAASQ
jgi:hypothetical protein